MRKPTHQYHGSQSLAPTSTAALFAARLLCLLAAAVIAGQLLGCGGRDDEADKTIDPLVCMHRPGLCT